MPIQPIKNFSLRILMPLLLITAGWFGFSTINKGQPEDPPDENRFTKSILAEKLDEPMTMDFLPDGRILIIERKGGLKYYDPKTGKMNLIATIQVNTKYTNKKGQTREAEEGLMGLIAHPDFAKNHWIYLYYADPKDTRHVLARFELQGNKLIESSRKILLEVPTQREECCHTGGGMVWDKEGNLYLTVGNNTVNPQSGTSNLDERVGMENSDDQRAAGSTNDLRGKILRIHPEDNGTYTIPEGNLFPKGTPGTKPEIYTMGHRNPWRISIDNKTGYIYWGEVGPDASDDSPRGPRGYDEFNQAKGPGFFGWPYFIGDNKPYHAYNDSTKEVGEAFDPEHPVNHSRNNTGMKELPPAQKAFIWYPYGLSEEFPLVGSSGRSATGGPVFRKNDFRNAPRAFPDYYEGKWLIVDFMRGWIMAVTMDEKGDYKSMERFLPHESFGSAIDMDFSPDGDLYVLEYGTAWFKGNDNAMLVKIEYNAGNRKPQVVAMADRSSGAVPFTVKLSAEGTVDFDGDPLTYEWKVTGAGITKSLKGDQQELKLDKPGIYKASLTVTDNHGAKSSKTIEIRAGNDPPLVQFDLPEANKTFYFPGQVIDYAVSVNDKEDGSLTNGRIKPSQVSVTIDYIPIGYDQIDVAQIHREADKGAAISTGQLLIAKNDCKACHVMDKKSIGPSYLEIQKKYKGSSDAKIQSLAKKIITGGSGVWGDHAMSAHPQISNNEAVTIVTYIMNIGEKKVVKNLPVKGNYAMNYPENAKSKGTFVLRAAYRDKGTPTMQPLMGEEIHILRYPVLDPELSDHSEGTNLLMTPFKSFLMVGDGSYLEYRDIDLTGIEEIIVNGSANQRNGAAGGTIELRLDAPDGTLLGEPKDISTSGRAQLNFPVKSDGKKHNLFFICRNNQIQPGQTIMQVTNIIIKPIENKGEHAAN